MSKIFILLLTTFLLANNVITAAEGQVEVNLYQTIDQNCDGIPEQKTKAANGECIIYQVDVVNHSHSNLKHVVVKGKIPQHTKIHTQIPLENNMLLSSMTEMEQLGSNEGFIWTRVETLQPGLENRRVFRYAVKVQ